MNTMDFVRESNRIEGIHRDPTAEEVRAHDKLIAMPFITVDDLLAFVGVYQPDAELRTRAGLDVRVGKHFPPPGGAAIGYALEDLLARAEHSANPYSIHVEYETLHPFTDGNGRSGRAVWAWMMVRLYGGYPLGFLHHFYYQSLAGARLPANPRVHCVNERSE